MSGATKNPRRHKRVAITAAAVASIRSAPEERLPSLALGEAFNSATARTIVVDCGARIGAGQRLTCNEGDSR